MHKIIRFSCKDKIMTKEEKRVIDKYIEDITKGYILKSITKERIIVNGDKWVNYSLVCR